MIARTVAPGEFLRERGFADAAEAAHGERGLRRVADGDGAFRGELSRERVEEVVAPFILVEDRSGRLSAPADEAFHGADVRMQDLLAGAGEHRGDAARSALVDAERFAHGLAQRSAIVQNRNEIGIGERGEHAGRSAIGDAEHDHALVEVGGIAREKGVVFLPAMLRFLVVLREQHDELGRMFEALLHHAHEVGVAEMLVLIERLKPRLADDVRDRVRCALVGARPRNEEVRMPHAPLRNSPRMEL